MYKELKEMYTEGDYFQNNPTWHIEDSPWKAKQVLKLIKMNNIAPKTICEIGCGAGEILHQLQLNMPRECNFYGYEISPQAFAMCKNRANDKLHFKLKDILQEIDVYFDLILLIDLIEHLEDYYSFLRSIKPMSEYKILNIPLQLTVKDVLRVNPLLRERELVGHLHFFNKEIAIQILKDTGYEIIDFFYPPATEQQRKSLFINLLRRLFFALHKDLAARIVGGYPLMVLAK
jgi:SAM-dependent methyltransferase